MRARKGLREAGHKKTEEVRAELVEQVGTCVQAMAQPRRLRVERFNLLNLPAAG